MTRSTTWALFVGGLLVFALAATAFFSVPSIAGNREHGSQKGPDAFWSVPRVNAIIKPGETKQIQVTLTAADGLDAGAVRIVPALAANVQVSPTSTPHLRKGQTQAFTLTFTAPINALPTTTDGVLQLRETEDKRCLGENIAKPLPLTIFVVSANSFINQAAHYWFTLPDGWRATAGTFNTSYTSLYPLGKSADADSEYKGDMFIRVRDNPNNLTLADFYQSPQVDNLFEASALQTPFSVNRRDAIRFDGVGGMLPSTVVAIRASNSKVLEVTDYGSHQDDGSLDLVIQSLSTSL